MKKSTYLGLFLLIGFLFSSGLGLYVSFHAQKSQTSELNNKQVQVSATEQPQNISNFLNTIKVEDENENELEHLFDLQAIIIPFIFSSGQQLSEHIKPLDHSSLAHYSETPIYIALRNFRI